jgi:hypothetical protein
MSKETLSPEIKKVLVFLPSSTTHALPLKAREQKCKYGLDEDELRRTTVIHTGGTGPDRYDLIESLCSQGRIGLVVTDDPMFDSTATEYDTVFERLSLHGTELIHV